MKSGLRVEITILEGCSVVHEVRKVNFQETILLLEIMKGLECLVKSLLANLQTS